MRGSSPSLVVLLRVSRTDLPGLYIGLRRVLIRGGSTATCDVAALSEPDLAAVDVLARLHLDAGRLGRRLVLQNVPRRLEQLLVLVGLEAALLGAGLESGRQPEQGEPALGVEEGVHGLDPPV